MEEVALSLGREKETVWDSRYVLELLSAIDREENISQRSLAARLGIAVGMANALVKRCVQKGWLKMQAVPARRYKYYVTPKGLKEKTSLVADYVNLSLSFFRVARQDFEAALREAQQKGYKYVCFVGAGELAEIAMLAVQDTTLEPVAIVDASFPRDSFMGLPVVRNIGHLQGDAAAHCFLLTSSEDAQRLYDDTTSTVEGAIVVAPAFLQIRY